MSNDDTARRIEELESQLRQARAETARYKEATFALLNRIVPDEPLTDEELRRMMTDTTGTPILDIVAEYEQAAGR